MVTEFWSGWFDHWTDARHNGLSVARFEETLGQILNLNASVNFYMFHGGTNFGFLNGANALDNEPHYLPDVTSYDYDSPLSESGDYTPKYDVAAQLIPAALAVPTRLPARPNPTPKRAYAAVKISEYLTLNELIVQVVKRPFRSLVSTLYRPDSRSNSLLRCCSRRASRCRVTPFWPWKNCPSTTETASRLVSSCTARWSRSGPTACYKCAVTSATWLRC